MAQAAAVTRALDALHECHEAELATNAVSGQLYRVGWQPAPPVVIESLGRRFRWLILADRRGVGDRLAERLREQGQQIRLLYAEDASDCTAECFDNPLSYLADDSAPMGGVIHLWGLDLPAEASVAALGLMRRLVMHSTLHLVKALRSRQLHVPVHLITRAAQSASPGDRVAPHQAPLWGMGRVLSLEHPEMSGKLIDLPADTEPIVADALLSELLSRDGEDQIRAARETASGGACNVSWRQTMPNRCGCGRTPVT